MNNFPEEEDGDFYIIQKVKNIRKNLENDIIHLFQYGFPIIYENPNDPYEALGKMKMIREMINNSDEIYVCKNETKQHLASMIFILNQSYGNIGNKYLYNIVTRGDEQRKGLVRKVIDVICEENPKVKLWLKVYEGNPAMYAYKKIGFRPIDSFEETEETFVQEVGSGTKRIVMVKDC